MAGTCEPDLPDTPTHLPLSTSGPPGRVPGLSPSPSASPPPTAARPIPTKEGARQVPPPVTLSVETPPSRPDLATAPLPSLTLLQPHWGPAHRDGPLFSKWQALPCLGAFALAVPVSYISACSTPSPPWGLCSMPPSKEAPTTPSPQHSSPLCFRSGDRLYDGTRSLGFPCHLPPTSVPRLRGRTGHLAASLGTLPECQHTHQINRARSGASDVRHPQ